MELEVEKAYNQIRQAALDDPQKPYTNAEFEGGVNSMRDFAQRRSDLVTAEVNASRR